MKRTIGALVLAASVGGCLSSNHSADLSNKSVVRASGEYLPPTVPGVTGPWGQPVAMAAPYTVSSAHITTGQAQRMMSQSVPLDYVQMDPRFMQVGAQMPLASPGGMMAPPGVPFTPPLPGKSASPSGIQQATCMRPGPGACPPGGPCGPGGGAGGGGGFGGGAMVGRTQIRFTGPDGMKIAWSTGSGFTAPMVQAPGRYNFLQASIYRLKLSNIRGRPGLEVYPTLEVVPANPKTAAFLAHSAVPIEFTNQDFQEIIEGKYLVKVIYLPDPQFQELAATGIDEIISTRLEPGADPILEAQRRGSILLVIRMGNVDQEAPNTPPLDSGCVSQAPMTDLPPGAVPLPAVAGPLPSLPTSQPTAALPHIPSPTGATSHVQDGPIMWQASSQEAPPNLPPRLASNTLPTAPAPMPPQSGGSMPPAPPMPPSPAELAGQTSR
jgi:hypothetical protein